MAADIKLSGYKATAVAMAWASGQTLDSLTDNEATDLTDEIDNGTTLYAFADVDVVLASAVFTGADSSIELLLVPTVDGTNYGTYTGNTTTEYASNDQYRVAVLSTTGTTAAQRIIVRDIPLPNGKFKWAFRSRLNVTTAGSGNSASWRPHQLQSV